MISVIGLPLEIGRSRLEPLGFIVSTSEVRSKKGLAGDSFRIIKETMLSDKEILLSIAEFQTSVLE